MDSEENSYKDKKEYTLESALRYIDRLQAIIDTLNKELSYLKSKEHQVKAGSYASVINPVNQNATYNRGIDLHNNQDIFEDGKGY
jgi:hypothetical protein